MQLIRSMYQVKYMYDMHISVLLVTVFTLCNEAAYLTVMPLCCKVGIMSK